jgi:hypothetical protein
LPLEDVHEVDSTNWKAVAIAVALVVFSGAVTLVASPYGWLIGSGVGVALLYVGTKLKRTPLVKTFSRSITSDAVIVSDSFEGKVTKAADRKDA